VRIGEILGHWYAGNDKLIPVYEGGPEFAHTIDLVAWKGLAGPAEKDVVLVSACLGGCPTRYDGTARYDPTIARLARRYVLVFACPESLGGLPIPHLPSEIEPGRNGDHVVGGVAQVLTKIGDDVTESYMRGSLQTLAVAKAVGARTAVLMDRSPACGPKNIHDGTFKGKVVPGRGVAATLLERNNIEVLTVEDITRLLED
jgi:uncharacterized protein YbbK (DUF523 family)